MAAVPTNLIVLMVTYNSDRAKLGSDTKRGVSYRLTADCGLMRKLQIKADCGLQMKRGTVFRDFPKTGPLRYFCCENLC